MACGPADTGVEIVFREQALLRDATRVLLYFYGPERSCPELNATTPRPPAILGPFEILLDEEERTRGKTYNQDDLPVGEYVVYADALDGNGAFVGWGCAAGQRVREREVARVRVEVR